MRETFLKSLEDHQIKSQGISGFAVPVTLESSDDKSFVYPARGVLVVLEQGVDLRISQAAFHEEWPNGSLSAPALVRNPKFTYL